MKLLLVLFFAMLASAFSQVPIPSRPDGYAISTAPATSPVVIDAFVDLLCPDCKAAWPTLKAVIAAYPSDVYFLLHTFPLPYHTNAFIANQGLHVVDRASMHNRTALLAYADLLFGPAQSQFYNAATMDQTITQVIAAMAAATEKAGILSAAAYTAGIANSAINTETRVSWKYACSRAATGTPTFFLNGVYISADAGWSPSDWKSVIDPILKENREADAHFAKLLVQQPRAASATSAANSTCPSTEKVCDYAPHESECCLIGESCIPNVGCRCLKAQRMAGEC